MRGPKHTLHKCKSAFGMVIFDTGRGDSPSAVQTVDTTIIKET
ncbi:hypothetical protein FHS72_002170 [Loktanella ponticola]|uniref:Uncharacterized protein n=1 Tax=Yoonia ponticola TaxID=1524255 RepID=A0A7W9EYC4_9RHOB|nr:hypothetical protein [Yoonia ponticola]